MRQINMFLCVIIMLAWQYAAADNIYFNFSDGSTAVYPVPDVRSITFSGDTMHLNKRDGTVVSWSVHTIGHYNYNQVATFVHPSKEASLHIFPNPSDGAVMFNYTIKHSQKVVLELLDINGNSIRKVTDQPVAAGDYTINWDGNDDSGKAVAAGTYICSLSIGNETITGKISIIHK